MDSMDNIDRRNFLKKTAAGAVAGAFGLNDVAKAADLQSGEKIDEAEAQKAWTEVYRYAEHLVAIKQQMDELRKKHIDPLQSGFITANLAEKSLQDVDGIVRLRSKLPQRQ